MTKRIKRSVYLTLLGASLSLADSSELSLNIKAPEPIIKSGTHLVIIATVVNKSQHDVTYHNTNLCDYDIRVTAGGGISATETPLKREMDCSGGTLRITGRDIVITLKPGESNSEEIRVAQQFDLSAPGRYSVQVDRNFPQIGKVESNVVGVTVTP
jgi:hypothetical protein